MRTITATKARSNLYKLIDETTVDKFSDKLIW